MSDLVRIDYDEIVRSDPDSILVRIDNEEIWFPESEIEDRGRGWLEIPEWLATDRGLT